MPGKVSAVLVVAALNACGGATARDPGGGDGGSSSSSGGSSSGSSSGSSGGSSGGSSSGSSGAGSSSGADAGRVPINHRPSGAQCSTPAPSGDCSRPGIAKGGCTSDATCTAGTNGRCIAPGGGPAADCFCTYDTCAQDTDCPSSQACACHGAPYTDGAGNTCVTGNCRADADCGAGGYCSPSSLPYTCGDSLAGYYCHTAADLCVDDSDCPANADQTCVYSTTDSHWECEQLPICE